MKNKSRFLFFVAINYLLILTYADSSDYKIKKMDVAEHTQLTMGNIVAGAGYSGDSQQVTSQTCYNANISSTSGQQGYVQLSASISFSELESKLGVSVSISGKYDMFAADAKASYMRSLQDKDYAISLNYYHYISSNVAVQIADHGVNALTEFGKKAYNDRNNTPFGLVCGDYYIASYEQGALLTMGLNIQLNSSVAKKEFNEKVKSSFGDIVSAAAIISSLSSKYNIIGSIAIQAFQMGGEPSQLSQILSYDSSGQYYALTCSLSAMQNCISAAGGLLHYATDNFPKQLENNKGITPLGIAFTQFNPIQFIGLNPPDSLVTQEVKEYRQELAGRLMESQYYQQKLYSLLNGYPVKLDATVIDQASLISSKAENNIRILMQPHDGAAGCFNLPYNCKSIRDNIESQLQNITTSDLKFLENMKYEIHDPYECIMYNTSGGFETRFWFCIPFNPEELSAEVCGDPIVFTDKQLSFCVLLYYKWTKEKYEITFTGNSTNSGMKYVGRKCGRKIGSQWPSCLDQTIITKQLSPFFFEAYSNTLNDIFTYVLLD